MNYYLPSRTNYTYHVHDQPVFFDPNAERTRHYIPYQSDMTVYDPPDDNNISSTGLFRKKYTKFFKPGEVFSMIGSNFHDTNELDLINHLADGLGRDLQNHIKGIKTSNPGLIKRLKAADARRRLYSVMTHSRPADGKTSTDYSKEPVVTHDVLMTYIKATFKDNPDNMKLVVDDCKNMVAKLLTKAPGLASNVIPNSASILASFGGSVKWSDVARLLSSANFEDQTKIVAAVFHAYALKIKGSTPQSENNTYLKETLEGLLIQDGSTTVDGKQLLNTIVKKDNPAHDAIRNSALAGIKANMHHAGDPDKTDLNLNWDAMDIAQYDKVPSGHGASTNHKGNLDTFLNDLGNSGENAPITIPVFYKGKIQYKKTFSLHGITSALTSSTTVIESAILSLTGLENKDQLSGLLKEYLADPAQFKADKKKMMKNKNLNILINYLDSYNVLLLHSLAAFSARGVKHASLNGNLSTLAPSSGSVSSTSPTSDIESSADPFLESVDSTLDEFNELYSDTQAEFTKDFHSENQALLLDILYRKSLPMFTKASLNVGIAAKFKVGIQIVQANIESAIRRILSKFLGYTRKEANKIMPRNTTNNVETGDSGDTKTNNDPSEYLKIEGIPEDDTSYLVQQWFNAYKIQQDLVINPAIEAADASIAQHKEMMKTTTKSMGDLLKPTAATG